MRICESAGLLQTGCDCSARFLCMFCRLGTLLHAFVVCDVVCALPTRGPIQRVVACAVTMCADVCEYKLDQRRSSDSSTDISITHFELKEKKREESNGRIWDLRGEKGKGRARKGKGEKTVCHQVMKIDEASRRGRLASSSSCGLSEARPDCAQRAIVVETRAIWWRLQALRPERRSVDSAGRCSDRIRSRRQ